MAELQSADEPGDNLTGILDTVVSLGDREHYAGAGDTPGSRVEGEIWQQNIG